MVTYDLNIDTSNPKNNLKGALNGMLRGLKDEMVYSKFTNFNGYEALDYKIKNIKGNNYLQGKLFLVNKTFYELMVSYNNENYNKADYNKFINSFTLLK